MKSETVTLNYMKKPKSFNVWDWVLTMDGRIFQINHDDMQDLTYEQIARYATTDEIALAKRNTKMVKRISKRLNTQKS